MERTGAGMAETELIGFHRVRLVTPEGMIVTDLVVPPFDKMPEVLLWGSRAFLRCTNPGMFTYRETTSYAAPYEEDDE
jgi:hypothetical protein